jgi:hypothetical protein
VCSIVVEPFAPLTLPGSGGGGGFGGGHHGNRGNTVQLLSNPLKITLVRANSISFARWLFAGLSQLGIAAWNQVHDPEKDAHLMGFDDEAEQPSPPPPADEEKGLCCWLLVPPFCFAACICGLNGCVSLLPNCVSYACVMAAFLEQASADGRRRKKCPLRYHSASRSVLRALESAARADSICDCLRSVECHSRCCPVDSTTVA